MTRTPCGTASAGDTTTEAMGRISGGRAAQGSRFP
jgi:hypothetical protein